MWFSTRYTLIIYWRSVSGQWSMPCHSVLPLSERNHEPWFVSLDIAIYCILDLVDPHGRHYGIPFRSRNHILDIIPYDQLELFDHSLLPFLLGYLFIVGRIYINDVTQQCPITRVYLRPLTFIGSLIILFFILNYLSYPRWSSYLKVDLPLSMAWSYHDSYIILNLFLLSWCIFPWELQVPLHFVGLNLLDESSSLFLWNKSHPSFLVGDYMWYFLQVKFSCMLRNIS